MGSAMYSVDESGDEQSESFSRPETPHAAQRIQDAWVGHRFRSDRTQACLVLQNWFRGWRDRKRANLREVRQKLSKFLLVMMEEGDASIKRRVKMALAYDRLANNAIETKAVTGFQSLFRARQARDKSHVLAQEAKKKLHTLELVSGIVIQSWTRRYLSQLFVSALRASTIHMMASMEVSSAIDAFVLSGGHPNCHWRRCRAFSILETLIDRWSNDSNINGQKNQYYLRQSLGQHVMAEMKRKNCKKEAWVQVQQYFQAEEIVLVLYGRRDWPSGAPLSLLCVQRNNYYVLTAHWQYLEGAALAGVTVISKEEAKELYGVKEEGDASNPTNAATPPVDIPDQPRSIIIDILRRGLRSRRRKEIKKEIKQENKGSAGKKNKKNKKKKKEKGKGKEQGNKSNIFTSWRKKKQDKDSEKATLLKLTALPLRSVPIGRIQLGIRNRLGQSYAKLYKNKPGFDCASLEQYCARFPSIFQVRPEAREIALILKDDEEDVSNQDSKPPGALELPLPIKRSFDYYYDKQQKKLSKKRAHKQKNELQLKNFIRSKWNRLSAAKQKMYNRLEIKDTSRYNTEIKAYNDQEVATGVKQIDPCSIEPARLPFNLHTTSLALVNQRQKIHQRQLRHSNAMHALVGEGKEEGEEDDEEDAFWETDLKAAAEAKRLAMIAKKEANEKSQNFLTIAQNKERKEDDEFDRMKREEISAYWFINEYSKRPTSQWCDVQLTVPLGQISGLRVSRVVILIVSVYVFTRASCHDCFNALMFLFSFLQEQNVDLDAVSMDALELAIFKCIPPSSRILKLSIRRTNNNEEKRVGDHHVEKRRLCCDCRLSDIESVLSILKHVRLNTLQAQTVHGHDIYLKLHGHPLLVSSLFSFFLKH